MEPWGLPQPPVRGRDIGPAVVLYAAVCGLGWVLGHFGLRFDLLTANRVHGSARYLSLAYAAAWLCIGGSLILIGRWMIGAIRRRQPPWPYAILAIPMLVESWLAGFVVALVATSF